MTLIYKINDLERKIPYKQWEALKKEFVEFAKEKKRLEANINEAIEYIKHSWRLKFDQVYDTSKYLSGWEVEELLSILERGKE